MDKKWTPGPWVVEQTHPTNACLYVSESKGGHEVCTLYGADGDWAECGPDGNWGEQPIREANAHLIAAAPDLYEALEACVDELMSILHGERDGVWSNEVFESVESPYRKALAKARGETQ